MYKEYAKISNELLSYSHILDTRKYPTRRVPHYTVFYRNYTSYFGYPPLKTTK